MDKFCWRVILREIIWRLQVQSQQQLRITRNIYHYLKLVCVKSLSQWFK